MNAGQRFLLTIAIALAAIFALALCGRDYWQVEEQSSTGDMFRIASAESQIVQLSPCMDEQTREQIRAVMLEALDNSLKSHIEHVFEVWLRDDRGQPGRARTGVQQGIAAYLLARKGTMDWAPPPCSG